MDAVKIVCVVLIPFVVFVGILGHNLADYSLMEILAPFPSIFVVLVQQMRAHGLMKGACGGLGLGLAGLLVFWLWLAAIATLMVYQVRGKDGFEE